MTPTELLAFETRWPNHTPAKVQAIRQHLRLTEVRYYILLHRAARSVDGIKTHPHTARMVRERAEDRARERTRRTAA